MGKRIRYSPRGTVLEALEQPSPIGILATTRLRTPRSRPGRWNISGPTSQRGDSCPQGGSHRAVSPPRGDNHDDRDHRLGDRGPGAHRIPMDAVDPAHRPVPGGPRHLLRPPPRTAVDAERRDVGALLLLRDARHPALLHHRYPRQRRPRPERQHRPGHPRRLRRRRLSPGDPRRHLRRPCHRPVAVHPLRRPHHHGRPHLPVDPRGAPGVGRDRLRRRRDGVHQAEPVHDRRRPLRR